MPKVSIRKKSISKGRQTLYLDYSPPLRNPKTGVPQRFEFLKLFIFDKPFNFIERRHNTETLELVENIRATRQLDIQNRMFGFISDRNRSSNFIDYFREYTDKKKKTESDNHAMAFRYFVAFAGHDIIFNDVDEFLCEDYRNFMLSGPGINRRGKTICKNTAVSYFAKFRTVLQRAYKQKLLTTDLYSLVKPLIPKETHREQLELEELQSLLDADCGSETVKKAAIFSGLTGLRFSDVHTLYWSEVRGNVGNIFLQFSQEKTEGAEILPISDQAYEILGTPEKIDQRVFPELSYSKIRYYFPEWLSNAGINKNITFHSFRHTYATLQLELGTDILTVSKMLGHRILQTTLVYTKVKDRMKVAAANRIKLQFKKKN
jgi:integrase